MAQGLFITHDFGVVSEIADRVIVMERPGSGAAPLATCFMPRSIPIRKA